MEGAKRKSLGERKNAREASTGQRERGGVPLSSYEYFTGTMQENKASTSKDMKSCEQQKYKPSHYDEHRVKAFKEVQKSESESAEEDVNNKSNTSDSANDKAKYEKETIEEETSIYEDGAYSETMLWISNLSHRTQAPKLVADAFKYGTVTEANVVTNANDPSDSSVGFLKMETATQADNCIQNVKGSKLGERLVTIHKKRPPELNLQDLVDQESEILVLDTEKEIDKQVCELDEMSERKQLREELYKQLMEEHSLKIERLERDQKRLKYERRRLERDKAKFALMQKIERNNLEAERKEFEKSIRKVLVEERLDLIQSQEGKKSPELGLLEAASAIEEPELPPYDFSRYKIDEADLESMRNLYTRGPLVDSPRIANVRDPRIQKNLGLPPSRDLSPTVELVIEFSHVPPKSETDLINGNKPIPVIDGYQSVNRRERGETSEICNQYTSNISMWDDENQGLNIRQGNSSRGANIENLHYITPSPAFGPGCSSSVEIQEIDEPTTNEENNGPQDKPQFGNKE